MNDKRQCRLCRNPQGPFHSMYDDPMAELMSKTLGIVVPEQDFCVCSDICQTCNASMLQFHSFATTCRDGNNHFQQIEKVLRAQPFKNDDETKYLHEPEVKLGVICETCVDRVDPCDNCSAAMKQILVLEQTIFPCEFCGKEYPSRNALNYHRRVHTCAFICPTCGASFAYLSSYTYHLNYVHSEERPYACHFCNKRYKKKDSQEQHMLTHQTHRPYSCDICESSFKRPRDLRFHRKTHETRVAKSCSQCTATFLSNSGLRAHMSSVHIGDRKFKCEYCGKAFLAKTTLQKHLHTHTKIKPHPCGFCEKGFFDKIQLKSHVSAMHNKVDFVVEVLSI